MGLRMIVDIYAVRSLAVSTWERGNGGGGEGNEANQLPLHFKHFQNRNICYIEIVQLTCSTNMRLMLELPLTSLLVSMDKPRPRRLGVTLNTYIPGCYLILFCS